MTNKNPIFIIDGSSFLYRAYYGIKPLQTSQGRQVQAVYGFCRMIKKLIKDFKVQHLIVVWDSKGKNIRHEIYPAYKATRQAPPSDLFEQKQLILQFLDDMKITHLAQEGIEADDLIYSLAKKFHEQHHHVMIVSSDKDLAQIVNHTTKIFDPFKDKIMGQDEFEASYGFALQKLPFYFSILGDTSDNIPGIKGIGEKGATELVTTFENLDDLYTNIDKVSKKRTQELLQTQKENAYLSLQLFTLQEYPVNINVQALEFYQSNWVYALPLLHQLEFKTLAQDIEKEFGSALQSKTNNQYDQNLVEQSHKFLHELYNFILITNEHDLKELCTIIQEKKACALDTETTGLDPLQDTCIGISIAIEEGTAYYIPFGHITKEPQLTLQHVQKHLAPLFADETIKKYLHHAKFDQIVLHQIQMPLAGVFFDTLIAASLLVQDWQKKGLKILSEFYFQETMLTYDQIIGKLQNFAHVPLDVATHYAAADAHQTLKLYQLFDRELKTHNLETLFYTIEMPINKILTLMQLEGIFCKKNILEDLSILVNQDLAQIEQEIAVFTPYPINLNSPKQIKELLFEQLGLPAPKKNGKSNTYSTDAQVLESLTEIHPIPKLLLKYRELFKLKSTYIESLPTFINPHTHKIHTSFNQTLVATGRLSSSQPNLQNIPTSNLGYPVSIRSAFQAEPGFVLLSADYSQIELRILAYMSQDTTLQQAFLQNQDIHLQTASKIFNTSLDEISSEQRTVGKTINFSILYGLTSYGLSQDLKIPYKAAKQYINSYFEQYQGVVAWMESIIEQAKKDGYVKTLWGRKRYIPGIYEKNKTLYEVAKRIAINSPVQGTAAEIMKLGMIHLDRNLHANKLQAKILLQIHDELILSVPEHQVEQTLAITKESLESVVQWNVPLQVETKTGITWQDITK